MVKQLGARHSEPPAAVPHLAGLVRLPDAPASYNWHKACNFGAPPDELDNDKYGCCVPAHALQIMRMLTSNVWGTDSWTPAPNQSLFLYSANTTPPFNTSEPDTDTGTDVSRFMQYWSSVGIPLTPDTQEIVVWARTNAAEAHNAIAFTGPIGITLNLPVAAQDMANWMKSPGTSTDWKPGSWGEHQVACGRYDTDSPSWGAVLTCITWAAEQALHPDFLAKYCLGMQAPLSRQLLSAAGMSPADMDWDTAMSIMKTISVS
jgi:hypothetical protein